MDQSRNENSAVEEKGDEEEVREEPSRKSLTDKCSLFGGSVGPKKSYSTIGYRAPPKSAPPKYKRTFSAFDFRSRYSSHEGTEIVNRKPVSNSDDEALNEIGNELQSTLTSINTSLDNKSESTSPKIPRGGVQSHRALFEAELERLSNPTSPTFRRDVLFQPRKLSLPPAIAPKPKASRKASSDYSVTGDGIRMSPAVKKTSLTGIQVPHIGTDSMTKLPTADIDLDAHDFRKASVVSSDLENWSPYQV